MTSSHTRLMMSARCVPAPTRRACLCSHALWRIKAVNRLTGVSECVQVPSMIMFPTDQISQRMRVHPLLPARMPELGRVMAVWRLERPSPGRKAVSGGHTASFTFLHHCMIKGRRVHIKKKKAALSSFFFFFHLSLMVFIFHGWHFSVTFVQYKEGLPVVTWLWCCSGTDVRTQRDLK